MATLPKANIKRLLKQSLPETLRCAGDVPDLVAECTVEFITLVTAQANALAEGEKSKVIKSKHLVAALKEMGFDDFAAAVLEACDAASSNQAEKREKKKQRFSNADGLSDEQMEEEQAALFAAADESD